MGISASDLPALTQAIEAVMSRNHDCLRVMCIGYPDVLLSDANYEKFFPGRNSMSRLVERPRTEELLRRHPVPAGEISHIPTIASFLSLYGPVEVDVIDIVQREGSEITLDLNYELPEQMRGVYDLLIDPGSTQYIFDVATCLFNYVGMLKVGGAIYHRLPLIMLNHGFYNFQPNLLVDFYEANGFNVLNLVGATGGVTSNPGWANVPPRRRFQLNNGQAGKNIEACVLFAAQKKQNVSRTIPVNCTYRSGQPYISDFNTALAFKAS